MQSVQLSEQLALSRIIQGFWRLPKWNMGTDELVAFMHGCIERGVTTFDTAEYYTLGLAEQMMGEAFAADPTIRRQVQLVSKCGVYKHEEFQYYNTSYARIMQSCKESLQRLQTDHLDLYLIHREDPMLDPWEVARAFQDLKREGLILEAGVSNMDPYKFDGLYKAMDGQLVTNQIEWNPVCYEHYDSGMMDYLTYHRIHPMIWSPLAGGRLFTGEDEACRKAMDKIAEIAERHGVTPAEIVYAWILYHPVGAMPMVGSQNLSRLDLAVKALDVQLERYEWYEIYAASGIRRIR